MGKWGRLYLRNNQACIGIKKEHYDKYKPMKMQMDPLRSGVGAVLIQDEKQTVYISKSLAPTQQRYAIVEQ